MSTAKMRLRAITCLDHAYINDQGRVIGGSYHINVDVAGKVDPLEQVVVDFSTIKKDLKAIIDAKLDGYDHKLWWINGLSAGTITDYDEGSVSETHITTAACALNQPIDSVRRFEQNLSGTLKETVESELRIHLWKQLNRLYPNTKIEVDVEASADDFSCEPTATQFRYSHGLKNSTSWGCQNLSHGHLSFIEWTYTQDFRSDCASCQSGVRAMGYAVDYMDDAIFVFRENIIKQTPTSLTLEYRTARGLFHAEYQLALNKIIILETETTIENIAAWFKHTFKGSLEMARVDELFISEGLAKGAVVRAQEDGQW